MSGRVPTAAGSDLVRGFERLSRTDVDYAGGKGANLGELTAAGLPGPARLRRRRPRLRRLLRRHRPARADRAAALRGRRRATPRRSNGAATEVRAMVEAEPLPAGLATAIGDAYAALAGDDPTAPVAVRSSATAEDTESASFAGMNETLLNVRGATRCWTRCAAAGPRCSAPARSTTAPSAASARPTWTSPSSSSARSRSTRAGVMFTIDPASGATRPPGDRGRLRARRGGRLGLGLARPLRRRQGRA